MKINPQRPNCCALKVIFNDVWIRLILLGVPPLGVYNQNTVNKKDGFQQSIREQMFVVAYLCVS